jgi:hypothetical protein
MRGAGPPALVPEDDDELDDDDDEDLDEDEDGDDDGDDAGGLEEEELDERGS